MGFRRIACRDAADRLLRFPYLRRSLAYRDPFSVARHYSEAPSICEGSVTGNHLLALRLDGAYSSFRSFSETFSSAKSWSHIAGWSSLVARRAHNPEAVGSNPAPATKCSTAHRAAFLLRGTLSITAVLNREIALAVHQGHSQHNSLLHKLIALDKRGFKPGVHSERRAPLVYTARKGFVRRQPCSNP